MNINSSVKEMVTKRKKALVVALAAAFLVIASLVAPQLSAKDLVYADDNASGEMTGSSSKPFKKIQDAINKAAKEHKDVVVKKGVYTENITILEDVEVNGTNKDDVIIIAADDDEEVVSMKDDTAIRKVTIKGGDRGVVVGTNDKATIEKSRIIENDKDGIKVKEGKTDKDHRVVIFENTIKDNGWNGVYSEKRKLTIMHNDIESNDKDGIELASGSEAYLEDNHMRYNGGHGMKVTIDGSEIWTYNNTFYESDKSGLEIVTKGKEGKIGIKRSKFYRNDDFGIARVEQGDFSDRQWANSVLMQENNLFWDNSDGDISPFINR